MVYNTTWMDTGNTFFDLTNNINSATGGVLGILLLFSLFVLIIFVFNRYDIKRVLILDGFITLVIGVLLWSLDWFPLSYLSVPITLFIISLVYFIWG